MKVLALFLLISPSVFSQAFEQPGSPAPAAATMSLWHFDEGSGTTASDAVGTNHGTLFNSPSWVTGMSGTALQFNGSTQYVDVNSGLILGTRNEYTIEAWVKWAGAGAEAAQTIYCEGSFNDLIVVRLINGVPDFTVLSGNWEMAMASSALSVGVWYHLAAVLEPGVGGKIYVNGQVAASNTNMGVIVQGGSTSVIGRFTGNGGSRYFNGTIDEVRISDTALQPSEFLLFPATPSVSAFSPASGSVGSSVTITGINFDTTSANNIVRFGGVGAQVTQASATSLNVTVPVGATYAPISVTTNGLTAYSTQRFSATFSSSQVVDATSFAPRVTFPTRFSPWSIAVGDIDSDGKLDAIVPAYNSAPNNVVSVLRNTSTPGTIGFAAKVDFFAESAPASVAVEDLDGDGKLDLICSNVNSSASTVSVFRNTSTTGSVSFATRIELWDGGLSQVLTIHDVNGDGKPDICLTHNNLSSLSVFRNTSSIGSLSFAAAVSFPTTTIAMGIRMADIDGDGKPDAVVANQPGTTVSVFRNASFGDSISFAPKVDFNANASPWFLAVGDIDGDSKIDVAVTKLSNGNVSVLRNTSSVGSVSFDGALDFPTGSMPTEADLGDVDGDGKPDLAVANQSSNTISVLRNLSMPGTVSFSPKVDYSCGAAPQGSAIADIDGDGKPELMVNNSQESVISVLRNVVAAPPPSGPSNLVATAVSSSVIDLSWTDNSNNEDGFRIERKTGIAGTYVEITAAGAGATTFQNSSLTSSTTYYYRVRAYNSGGSSGYSNEDSATTTSAGGGDITAPAAPISPGISPPGWSNASAFAIFWTNPSDPSGISKVWYRIGAAPTVPNPGTSVDITAPTAAISIATEGESPVYFYLEDGSGNKDPNSYVLVNAKYDIGFPSVNHDSTAVLQFTTTSPSNIQIQAGASDVISGVGQLLLQYKRAGVDWTQPSILSFSNPSGSSVSIPSSFFSTNAIYGVDYRIVAVDSAGNQTYSPTHSISVRQGSDLTRTDGNGIPVTQVSTASLPSGAPLDYAYRLVSVPLNPDNKTPSNLLETKTQLGSYDVKLWRFFGLNASDQFEEYPSFKDQAVVGLAKAFLLILKNGAVLKVGPGVVAKVEDMAKTGIPLKTGYNLVGNPFNFDFPVDSLSLASGDPLTNVWELVGVGGTNGPWRPNPAVIKGWEGIVINQGVRAPTTLKFNIADRPHTSRAPAVPIQVRSVKERLSDASWYVKVNARRLDNGVIDVENIFGAHSRASNEADDLDLLEPPQIGDKTLSVYARTNHQLLTHDLRVPAEVGYVWDLEVSVPDQEALIELSFEGLETIPEEACLIDLDSRIVHKLRRGMGLNKTVQNGQRKLRLIVGSQDFADAHSPVQVVPTEFRLDQNYPNPFNPSTVVRYQLPFESKVRIVVFNLLGEELGLLVDGTALPGYYEVEWRPMLASGVYFCKIEANALNNVSKRYVSVMKMILMK